MVILCYYDIINNFILMNKNIFQVCACMSQVQLSGLQRQVLSFIRQCLRECKRKPMESKKDFVDYIMRNARNYQYSIDKRDIQTIEHLLRTYKKQFSVLKDPNVIRMTRY